MNKFNIKEYRDSIIPDLNAISGGDISLGFYRNLSEMIWDFDVYLPTYQINLQRDFVWSLKQKQELIVSIFKNLKIPPVSVIINDSEEPSTYIVIDGKQRIKSIIDYLNNCFFVLIQGRKIYYKDLDLESQRFFNGKHLFSYVMYSNTSIDPISDLGKIKWFNYINFAGTPQDKKHIQHLESLIYNEPTNI